MGQLSLESNSSIQFFPYRIIRSCTILPHVRMRSSSKTHPTRIRKPQVPRNRRWHNKCRTEPKTPLDNQLQYKQPHSWKFISLQAQQTRRTKRNFGHPKVTTTRRNSWKINRLNNQSKNYNQYNPKIITLQKKQFEGHTTAKRNSRNEEYMTVKRTRRKPRRLVVTTTITTRKH